MSSSLMVSKTSAVSEDFPRVGAFIEINFHFNFGLHRQRQVGAEGLSAVKAHIGFKIRLGFLISSESGFFPERTCLSALLLSCMHPPVISKASLILETSPTHGAFVAIFVCITFPVCGVGRPLSKVDFTGKVFMRVPLFMRSPMTVVVTQTFLAF